MFDQLENLINGLTDMDWGWWPVLFLRPPKDQDMDNLMLLRLTLGCGSVVGALFLLAIVVGATETLTVGDIHIHHLLYAFGVAPFLCLLQDDLCLFLESPRPAAPPASGVRHARQHL